MLIDCTTKGCLQKTEAKLNISTNEVICDECGNIIENVTEYIKRALKSSGQVMRSKAKEPFQTFCKTCNASKSLYVDADDKAFCKSCNSQIQITASFLNGLKEYLKNKDKE